MPPIPDKRIYPEEVIEEIRSKYQDNCHVTYTDLANEYHVSYGTIGTIIRGVLSYSGYPDISKQPGRRLKADYFDTVIEMWNSGMSYTKISKELGIGTSTVQRIVRKWKDEQGE